MPSFHLPPQRSSISTHKYQTHQIKQIKRYLLYGFPYSDKNRIGASHHTAENCFWNHETKKLKPIKKLKIEKIKKKNENKKIKFKKNQKNQKN